MKLRRQVLGSGRIEALSDNIFAVAMTLLIVNIKVPTNLGAHDVKHVWALVLPLWHHLRAFALSFIIIGLYWVAHHRVFALIERSDVGLLLLNLVFMGFTVLTPFSTGLLGQFDDSRVALTIYGTNIICISLTLQGIWWYATAGRRLTDPAIQQKLVRSNTARNLSVVVLGLVGIVVSFFNVTLSLWTYLFVPVAFLWPFAQVSDSDL